MKYLREFSTNAEYEAYIANTNDLPNVSLIDENDSVKYKQKPDYSKEYLTFVALEDGTFKWTVSLGNRTIYYSIDNGETWVSLAKNANTPTIRQGEKIIWKSETTPNNHGICSFSSTGKFNAIGNPMSLKYGDNFTGQTSLNGNDFKNMFKGATNLVSAEHLSLTATTTSNYSYQYMFDGCSSLTAAPELPATTFGQSCYHYMFRGCTSLTTAPELPATTLNANCYNSMFSNCTSLTTAPELPASYLESGCYTQMFYGCSSLNYIKMLGTYIGSTSSLSDWVSGVSPTGTFVKSASMTTLPTGADGIPENWTVQDA